MEKKEKKHHCDQPNCKKAFLRPCELTEHKAFAHNIDVVWHSCDLCEKQFKNAKTLNRHKTYVHEIRLVLLHCLEENCDRKFKTRGDLKVHLLTVHSNGKPFTCDYAGCAHKCNKASNLKAHKARKHNVGVFHVCEEKDCGKMFKTKGDLKAHLSTAHSNEKPFACDYAGCTHKCNKASNLKTHKARKHNVDVVFHVCEEKDCGKMFKTKGDLKGHQKYVHKMDVVWFACKQDNCKAKFKKKSDLVTHTTTQHNANLVLVSCGVHGCLVKCKTKKALKTHQANVHGIGTKWHLCAQENCTSRFKQKSDLTQHEITVHDIGKFRCDLCVGASTKLTTWIDPITTKTTEICRKCYHKVTDKKDIVEKEIGKWLAANFAHPMICQDQRVNGEACLKYRPDIMYSCGAEKLVIYVEIDEHEHLQQNSSYRCEEKRMSELYDETPGCLVVFVRFNPHKYTPEANETCLSREDRLELLRDTLKYIAENSDELKTKSMLHVFYICYSPDNPLIAKNIPSRMMYWEYED